MTSLWSAEWIGTFAHSGALAGDLPRRGGARRSPGAGFCHGTFHGVGPAGVSVMAKIRRRGESPLGLHRPAASLQHPGEAQGGGPHRRRGPLRGEAAWRSGHR